MVETSVAEVETGLTVLVVEDDAPLVARVAAAVAELGWRSVHAATVAGARELLAGRPIDLIYLDRMLADGADGLDLLEWFRDHEGAVPGTLVASRLSTPADHVRGLDLGADDYIDKPFDDAELKARLRALARRVANVRAPQSVLVWGKLEIRTLARVALWSGARIDLSSQPFDVLRTLAVHRGEWVSNETLWREVWPSQIRTGVRKPVLHNCVKRLRQSLESCAAGPSIESAARLGYRLVVPA